MKIVFVNVEDHMFLNQRLNLALAAKDAGFEVVIASRKSELCEEICSHGFKYIDTGNNRELGSLISEFASIYRLYKIFVQEQPDIVHNISIKPVIYGSLAARLAKVKKIVNLVNGLGYVFIGNASLKRWVLKTIVLKMYRFALSSKKVSVIFQNPDDLTYFINNKITSFQNSNLILGSGVDTEVFSPGCQNSEESVPKILFFGRMLWDKGVQYLIEAAIQLKSEGIEFTLNFAGEPDVANPSHISMAQLEKWQRDGLINYLGYCHDMVGVIRDSDLIVLPTHYPEGVPLSLIEAASIGKPIVTTDTPGCREIVQDGVNGFLVPIKDSAALANKIKILIKNKDLMSSFGEQSRRRTKKLFSKEIVNKKTLEIYHKTL